MADNQQTRATQAAGFVQTYLENIGTLQQTRVTDVGSFQADAREAISQGHVDARKDFALAQQNYVFDVGTEYQTSVANDTPPNMQPWRDGYFNALRAGRYNRAFDVGQGWLDLQTDLAGATGSFASGYNTKVTNLLSDLQGRPNLANSVEQTWATNTGNARKQQRIDHATYQRDFVVDQNLLWVTYAGALQLATSGRENGEATNWGTYQRDRAQRERNEANTAFLADPTNQTLRDAYVVAEGQLGWATSIQSDYSSYISGREIAEQGYQTSVTAAANFKSLAVANARIPHATDTETADRDFDYNMVVDGQASTDVRRGYSDTWSNSQAAADGNRRTGLTTVQNQYAFDAITAERTYRQNKYLASGTPYTNESDHTTGLQNVELAYRRGDVDKTSAWQSSSAQADWSYDRNNATRDKTDAIDEANRYKDLDTAWADADKTLQLAQIAEDVTEANTTKTAKYTRATALVTADTNYRDGQFTADVAAWTAVNSALNNAWSDAKLDEATAKQSAWNTVRPQFITKETDIAVAERTYRGTAVTEYDLMAQEAADARRDGSVDQANVDVSVATARGTATEKYGHGIADATRDWQKLDAWNKRHARWGSLDTTTAPNNIVWSTAAPTVEGTYFNDMAQAARDEVTWWGTAYLAQVDREGLAVKTQDANLAEAARVRDNAIAGYESAFDVLWNNTVNTAVQSAMFSGGVALTPWHGYVGATTQAEHDRTATTRPEELTLDTARNDAEKVYQVAVADARKTLAHNRGQQDINKAMQDANTDIAKSQTQFNSRTPLEPPTALEYSDGFGEPFPARPRRAVEYFDPSMPYMPYMPITQPNVFEPTGYGLYEDGASKPWGDLLHPPAHIGMGMPSMPPTNSTVPNFTPWFEQGYEPEWSASVDANSIMPGVGMYSTGEEAHDEYGDGMDGGESLPGDPMTFFAQSNFAWNSPASVFGRAQSQTAWEELVTSLTTTSSAPWWKATMSTVYTGATGPKINGNSLVTLLTNAVEGAAGVDLPDPGASTLLTSTPSTPADPTRVGGPQATVPGNGPDRPQGKSDTQLAIEAEPYDTVETTLEREFDVEQGEPALPDEGEDIGSSDPLPMDTLTGNNLFVPNSPLNTEHDRIVAQLDTIGGKLQKLLDAYVRSRFGTEDDFFDRVESLRTHGFVLQRQPGDDLVEQFIDLESAYEQTLAKLAAQGTPETRHAETEEWALEDLQKLWALKVRYTKAVVEEQKALKNKEVTPIVLKQLREAREEIGQQLRAVDGAVRDPNYVAGDEALLWSHAEKFYESLKYAVEKGHFKDELLSRAQELLQTLSNPEAMAQFVGMMAAGMALRKGIKCGTRGAGIASGALAAGEVAAFVLKLEAMRQELNGITYKREVANAAPHVAEFTVDILKDAAFMAWARGWKCFPAGTQVVIGIEEDESLPNGRRYITKAIETLQVGDMVLSREEAGERLSLQAIVDTSENDSAHLRAIQLRTLDGHESELRTTETHPFWVHEHRTYVEAGKLELGMTMTGPHNQPVKITGTRLEEFSSLRPVFNFTVQKSHNYFVLPDGSDTPILVHNDDCPKGSKGSATDGATKVNTPNEAARRKVQGEYIDPMSNRPVRTNKSLAADHIFPAKEIKKLPGFDKLTAEQKAEVLNYIENFQGLPKPMNSSKGARINRDWSKFRGTPLDSNYQQNLDLLQGQLKKDLQKMIDAFLEK